MLKRISILLLLAGAVRAEAPGVADLVRLLREQASGDQALRDVRTIWTTDRWFTFPKFHETAGHVTAMMNRAGLENVEIINPPADGVTQYGYWTMPMAWDVKEARLEIVEPAVGSIWRALADYQKVPTSVGMWSGPTPPEGITAEVIALDRPLVQLDVKGKFVLTDRNPGGLKWQLVKKGAAGAINAFSENKDLPDGRQWVNAWGDNGWAYTKGSTPLVCFSISPREATYLRGLMAKGPVKLHAKVDSRYYAGVYPYVTGVIRGSDLASKEVLTLGHLSEQGANDNATGVSAMIGAAELLNKLIAAGTLPRPRRTIRFLAMGECYGSMHYLATNPERVKNTVAAMCLDTPAADYKLGGTEYTWYLNPHSAKSFSDSLILRLAEQYFPGIGRPWHFKEYTSGTDNYLGDPLIGVPTVWPYSGSGVHTHHNSADTPETVDARSLRDLIVMDAAYLYSIAAAGPQQARWMAELTLTRGYQEIAAAAAPALEKAAANLTTEEQGRVLQDGIDRIQYALDRSREAVRSIDRLERLDDLSAPLDRCAEEQKQRLRRAFNGVNPIALKPNPEAARIVVRRKRIGTITLDDLPPDQREGYPAASFSGPPVTALYWCDGKRNLAEVIRLTQLEVGPTDFDFLGYFKFLERHGYVEFVR